MTTRQYAVWVKLFLSLYIIWLVVYAVSNKMTSCCHSHSFIWGEFWFEYTQYCNTRQVSKCVWWVDCNYILFTESINWLISTRVHTRTTYAADRSEQTIICYGYSANFLLQFVYTFKIYFVKNIINNELISHWLFRHNTMSLCVRCVDTTKVYLIFFWKLWK